MSIDWKPIETAPKDGTEILLRLPLNWLPACRNDKEPRIGSGFHIESGWFNTVRGVWENRAGHWWREHSVTHWCPLEDAE